MDIAFAMELIFLGLRLSYAPEERKVAGCELSKGPVLPKSRGSLSVFLGGLVSFLTMWQGARRGFLPTQSLEIASQGGVVRLALQT